MTRQLALSVGLALIMVLGSACTTTTEYSKTIGSSSASGASATSHDSKRDRNKEAAETFVQLGVGYLGKGDRQLARFNLLKALSRDDRSGSAHNAMALLYQLEKENTLAEEHFLKAIRYEPELTRVKNNYAVFLYRQQRYEEAYKLFVVASEDINYNRRGQIFFSMGQVAKYLGKGDEAQKAWEKSINLNPQLAESYLELAGVYFKAGDYPKTKRYLNRYEALSRPSPRGLWLAVRLERAFGNKDGEASKGLALKKMFPYSKENLEYKEWLKAQ